MQVEGITFSIARITSATCGEVMGISFVAVLIPVILAIVLGNVMKVILHFLLICIFWTFMFYVALFQHDFTLDIIVMFVLTFIFFVSGVYFVTVYVLTRLYFAVYILVALVFIIVLVVNINL